MSGRPKRKVWVVVEMFGGLPEGLWVTPDKESAKAMAAEIAAEAGFEPSEDGRYWVRGDSELHVRESENKVSLGGAAE